MSPEHQSAFGAALIAGAMALLAPGQPARANAAAGVEIAAALSLTGDSYTFGQGSLEGIQLAMEEANAAGAAPRLELKVYDDRSTDEGAKEVAGQIVAGRAALVLGPAISTVSLAAGPIYAAAGLPSLTTTATSDLITRNATTFRVLFKNSEQGEMLATYLHRVLGARKATVVVIDNGYGRTLESGFRRAAERLGIEAQYHVFKTEEEAEQVAQRIAAEKTEGPLVFCVLDGEGARMLPTLRRLGVHGPFLGGDAFGDDSFSARLAGLPEEKRQPGYFSEGLYGISPMILDSANAEILGFAERFRARFKHDPVWFSVAGYDAARLAIATLRGISAGASSDTQALRVAALNYLNSLTDPVRALPGLLGPLSFDAGRGRQQAIRIGRFNRGRFESAPLQIVPVTTPDAAELASGAVFEIEPGRFARLQRVVYTGVYINEIPRIETARSSFGADFYLWLRFAREGGPGGADPTDILFPNMIGGSFARTQPAEQGDMPDGTSYRLWRVQGEFRNDFDLHRFPFDRQTLSLPFFNARAAADRIVYVLDKRAPVGERAALAPGGSAAAGPPRPNALPPETLSIASPEAFHNLSQWEPRGARQRRENLVTDSSLGDPRRVGVDSFRELSGYVVSVEFRRQTLSTLSKNLLPLLLMTFIMFASLHFPVALVKEKVTVAVSGALSGAVLLTAINSQLGSIGYTVAVEYAFYLFFGLSLLCIVSVLGAERLRAAGREPVARITDRWTRHLFLLVVVGTAASAWWMYAQR